MEKIFIDSPEGAFTACFTERGLARLECPANRRGNTLTAIGAGHSKFPGFARWKKLTAKALAEALAGRAPRNLPPLDLSKGSAFQQQVWTALQQIPAGKTQTYAQVAATIRRPLATRAVGSACGANPVLILVPCHRVLPKNGGLGGFSSGLKWKRRLLELEGVRV